MLFAYESEELARGKEKCARRRFRIEAYICIWVCVCVYIHIYIYIYIYKTIKGRTIGWVGHEARMGRNARIILRKTRRGHKEDVE